MRRVLTTNPRSGTHYLKTLISAVLGADPVEKRYQNAADLDATLSSVESNRLVYDHFHFTKFGSVLDTLKFGDLRLVALTRHPLDRLISQLAYEKALGGRLPSHTRTPQQLAREMMLGQWDGKPWEDGFVVADYAAIHNHYLHELVSSWLEFRRCLLVRFEELVARPSEILARCLDHLHVNASPNDIQRAVKRVTFASLSNGRQPGQVDELSHYRCGLPGEWRRVFSPDDIKIMRPKYAEAFARGGYPL